MKTSCRLIHMHVKHCEEKRELNSYNININTIFLLVNNRWTLYRATDVVESEKEKDRVVFNVKISIQIKNTEGSLYYVSCYFCSI